MKDEPCFLFADIAIDWSDHGLWWPEKNLWLTRTRSTLDQYSVQADARLWFTPMHKNLRLQLPDLQILDHKVDFSSNVFNVVVRLCKELSEFPLHHFILSGCGSSPMEGLSRRQPPRRCRIIFPLRVHRQNRTVAHLVRYILIVLLGFVLF
jgi:hypothetical protein